MHGTPVHPLGHRRSHRSSSSSRQRGRAPPPCRAAPQSLATGAVVKTPTAEIRWGSFLSTEESLDDAVDECVGKIMAAIGPDAAPDLAIVFVSAVHGPDFDQLVPLLRDRVPSLKHVFGCSVGRRGGPGG